MSLGMLTYAGAGLLSGRQRHGGGEEEGEREETHCCVCFEMGYSM